MRARGHPYTATRPTGHTASRKYRVITTVWFSRYVQGSTPALKPAEWMRGPDRSNGTRISHVNARPAYNARLRVYASLNDRKTNTRSKSTTISGAVTIDSLHAMPSAHATIAASCQRVPPRSDLTLA